MCSWFSYIPIPPTFILKTQRLHPASEPDWSLLPDPRRLHESPKWRILITQRVRWRSHRGKVLVSHHSRNPCGWVQQDDTWWAPFWSFSQISQLIPFAMRCATTTFNRRRSEIAHHKIPSRPDKVAPIHPGGDEKSWTTSQRRNQKAGWKHKTRGHYRHIGRSRPWTGESTVVTT